MDAKVATSDETEEATFDFDSELPLGEAYLEIVYKGILNGDMKGFYRTRYTTNWGEERYAATTQFEVGGVNVLAAAGCCGLSTYVVLVH